MWSQFTPPQPHPCGVDETTPIGENNRNQLLPTICTSDSVVKYIRVAIHYLLPENGLVDFNIYYPNEKPTYCTDPDGSGPLNSGDEVNYLGLGNFTENGDGWLNRPSSIPSTSLNGYTRAKEIITKANELLDNNNTPNRKVDGEYYPETPPEIKHRYVLSGVYFHRDDEAYDVDYVSRFDVHNTYGVDKENTINVYYSPLFPPSGAANNIGGSSKFVFNNSYLSYISCTGWDRSAAAPDLLNHEIGHTLGLRHVWNEVDGCDDTKRGELYQTENCIITEANCWAPDQPTIDPPCPVPDPNIIPCPQFLENSETDDDWKALQPCACWKNISTNIMDYSSHISLGCLTPCQIGMVNADLSDMGNEFIYSCDGCAPSQSFFDMPEEVNYWRPSFSGSGCVSSVPVILDGQASWNEDEFIIELCEIDPSDPENCLTQSNTGWLSGAVGEVDLNDYFNFNIGSRYRVELTVNNSLCPRNHSYVREVEIICTDPGATQDKIELQAVNPFQDDLTVYHTILESGMTEIRAVHLVSGKVYQLVSPRLKSTDDYIISIDASSWASGNYALQGIVDGQIHSIVISKP